MGLCERHSQSESRTCGLQHDAVALRASAKGGGRFDAQGRCLIEAIRAGLVARQAPLFIGKIEGLRDSAFIAADTEPDGWARRVIMRDHAKRRQAARRAGKEQAAVPLQSIDFLLAVDDASRVGALRFQNEAGIFCRATEVGRRTAPSLIELSKLLTATRAVETENESAADLAYLRGRGTSIGGMRPKCTVVDQDGRLSVCPISGSHEGGRTRY